MKQTHLEVALRTYQKKLQADFDRALRVIDPEIYRRQFAVAARRKTQAPPPEQKADPGLAAYLAEVTTSRLQKILEKLPSNEAIQLLQQLPSFSGVEMKCDDNIEAGIEIPVVIEARPEHVASLVKELVRAHVLLKISNPIGDQNEETMVVAVYRKFLESGEDESHEWIKEGKKWFDFPQGVPDYRAKEKEGGGYAAQEVWGSVYEHDPELFADIVTLYAHEYQYKDGKRMAFDGFRLSMDLEPYAPSIRVGSKKGLPCRLIIQRTKSLWSEDWLCLRRKSENTNQPAKEKRLL